MKSRKSLLHFVWKNISNETQAPICALAFVFIPFFLYYAKKCLGMLSSSELDIRPGIDASEITISSFFVLLIGGVVLAILVIKRDLPVIIRNIRKQYYSYLFMFYAKKLDDLYNVRKEVSDSYFKLSRLIQEGNEVNLNILYSETWREQGFYINSLIEKENYEKLAEYVNADKKRIEFEKNNNIDSFKDSVNNAESEISKIQLILDSIDAELDALNKEFEKYSSKIFKNEK